jgi:large repetitive protein
MHGSDQHRGVVSRRTGGIRVSSRTCSFLAAALLLATFFATVFVSSGAAAAPLKVCGSGCPYSTITAALADAGDGDTIVVSDGTFAGALSIDKDVVIAGAAADETSIELEAGGSGSVVTVSANTDVTLSGVTITGGSAALGAGIHSDGNLTLKDVAVVENNASDFGSAAGIFNGAGGVLTLFDTRVAHNMAVDGVGGGIHNSGIAVVKGSLVEENGAGFVGAGIYNEVGATMDLVNTTVRHNFSALSGGGIGNKGTLTVRGGRIIDNTAQIFGGGILNIGELKLTATDVTGNTAAFGWGGGLYNEGTATLRGSSVSHNTADVEGGGVYNLGVVDLLGTEVSANSPDDCVDC